MWITTNCGKFLKRWEYQTPWPASWEICIQVKKQQLELDMEQQTGSKLGKEDVKAVYCHPAYLTYMQSTSWETLGWRKHKLEWRLLEVKWSEVKWSQSCPTLCDPMDCSLPGSSVHGILQARILEWVAISFSRGSSCPRDRTQVSCIAGRRFTIWGTRKAIRLLGEISITLDMQVTPSLLQKATRNWRTSWWRWKRRVKSWLKVQCSKH